jgi:hypothetical protein
MRKGNRIPCSEVGHGDLATGTIGNEDAYEARPHDRHLGIVK